MTFDIIKIGFYDFFYNLFGSSHTSQSVAQRFVFGLRPVLWNIIIDVFIVAENRPEHVGGGQPLFFGGVDKRFSLIPLSVPRPGRIAPVVGFVVV